MATINPLPEDAQGRVYGIPNAPPAAPPAGPASPGAPAGTSVPALPNLSPAFSGNLDPLLTLPPSSLTEADKQAIAEAIKKIGRLALDSYVKASEAQSAEERERILRAARDRLYAADEDTKKDVATGIGVAAAAINAIPVFGQIASAILAALAALVRAVPVARSEPGPVHTVGEQVQFFTYRGFTRFLWLQQHQDRPFDIGGGFESRRRHEALVDDTLARLSRYVGFNLFPYFPQGDYGPAPRKSFRTAAYDPYGDNSRAEYLAEVFVNLPEIAGDRTYVTDQDSGSALRRLVSQTTGQQTVSAMPPLALVPAEQAPAEMSAATRNALLIGAGALGVGAAAGLAVFLTRRRKRSRRLALPL